MPPNLEPFIDLDTSTFGFVQVSTRSRYAQFGIEVPSNAPLYIAATIKEDTYQHDQRVNASVPVRNHSPRPIHLKEGTGLFKLFADNPPIAMDQKLIDLVRTGKIRLSGKKGIDWAFDVLFSEYDESYHTHGIWLRLNPEKRFWLPPDPNRRTLEIPEGSEIDYRREVDRRLRAAPFFKDPTLWVGETVSRLKLDPSVNARISTVNPTYMNHANSLLIDGGSDWRIRTEIISPILPYWDEVVIFLHFYT